MYKKIRKQEVFSIPLQHKLYVYFVVQIAVFYPVVQEVRFAFKFRKSIPESQKRKYVKRKETTLEKEEDGEKNEMEMGMEIKKWEE